MSLNKPDNTPGTGEWPEVAETVFQAYCHALATLAGKPPALLVAFSGGLDSTVLLHAAQRYCRLHGASLRAVYVDHGLQAVSADWAAHCRREGENLGVDVQVVNVEVESGAGVSPEQAARDARYAALATQLNIGEWMLTAHHADDQAETVLLQLLRGAGVRGLAAMPQQKSFAGGLHLRPLLNVSRQQLQQAAECLRLNWIEDQSNEDTRFDRNFIRRQIMPVLRERWPSVSQSASRSASHCAQAATLLSELAAADAPLAGNVMPINRLLPLSVSRRANVLRGWIEQHGYLPPSTIKLQHIERDLLLAADDSCGMVEFNNAQIRRHRHSLYLGAQADFTDAPPFRYQWTDRQQAITIVETGQIITAADIELPWLDNNETLLLQSRQGGERLRLKDNKHSHSVKSLLQQQGLPPWLRSRVPFVWHDGRLVGVIGIGFAGPMS